jgi:hypothetical protein
LEEGPTFLFHATTKKSWQTQFFITRIQRHRESIAGRARKSVRELVKDIEGQRGKTKSKSSVQRELIKQDLKAFHVIKKPLITERNREDRLAFCYFLRLWDVDDFVHLAPCDEFFIWTIHGPKPQNDRIWARSVEDITDDEHYRQVVKHSDCIG